MKRMIVYCVCVLMSLPIVAQRNRNGNEGGERKSFDPTEFRMRMERFIIQEAGITSDEAAKFFPIFHEMKEKQMKIGRQIMDLKKQKKPSQMTDKECTETVLEIESLKVEQAEVGASYTKKLCKAISSKKVFRALNAEDRFHRMMLRDFRKGKE